MFEFCVIMSHFWPSLVWPDPYVIIELVQCTVAVACDMRRGSTGYIYKNMGSPSPGIHPWVGCCLFPANTGYMRGKPHGSLDMIWFCFVLAWCDWLWWNRSKLCVQSDISSHFLVLFCSVKLCIFLFMTDCHQFQFGRLIPFLFLIMNVFHFKCNLIINCI